VVPHMISRRYTHLQYGEDIFFFSDIWHFSSFRWGKRTKTPTHRALFRGWGKKDYFSNGAEQKPHDHMVPNRVLSKLLEDNQTGPVGDV
jgi:hypothetical protein